MVVAIIALLAMLALPNFTNPRQRAEISAALTDVHGVALGVELYKQEKGKVPIATAMTDIRDPSLGLYPNYVKHGIDQTGLPYLYGSSSDANYVVRTGGVLPNPEGGDGLYIFANSGARARSSSAVPAIP